MDWWEKKKVTKLPYPPLKKEKKTKDTLFGNNDGSTTVVVKNTMFVENNKENKIDYIFAWFLFVNLKLN